MNAGQASPCPCRADDAEAAHSFWTRGEVLRQFVDESHFSVRVVRCRSCGRRALRLFFELMDLSGGDDSQAWITGLLTDSQSAALEAPDADWLAVATDADPDRRFIARVYPRGGNLMIAWGTGPLPMFPHD